MSTKKLIVLVGPTASGKTEVAYEISKMLPIEAVSCDSMQVYRSMPIVTQAPPKDLTKKIPIHLASFLNPEKEYNAALFRAQATPLLEKIIKKGRTPLLVGGTGLYMRALLYGLFESEDGQAFKDDALRERLKKEAEKGVSLHENLLKVDPVSAARIHPNDTRRLIRALEVYELTGKPISAQQPLRKGIQGEYLHKIFFLNRERQDLYDRINCRVDEMLEEGLIKEVKRLVKKSLSLTAQSALGIKEIRAYLEKKSKLEDATTLLKKNTRNYAKRQLSWFRHEKGVEAISVAAKESAKSVASRIVKRWEEFLL